MSHEQGQAIITQRAEAVRLSRDASTAFDNAIAGLRVTLDVVAARGRRASAQFQSP
jgi:hypothetical protein